MSHFKAKMHQILYPAFVRSFDRVKLDVRDGRKEGRTVCPSLRRSL